MGLAEHIANDPDARGYAAMTARETYDDLNTKRRTGEKQVTYKSVLGELGADIGRRLIDSMKAASASDSVVETWHNMLVRGESINVNNAEVQGMLSTFADTPGLPLTTDDRDQIVALSLNQSTDAQFYGLLPMTVHQVIQAKGN